jgi:hypothetical protein
MFPGEGSIYMWTNKEFGAFMGFFIFNTAVYNYSFGRLLFVSGLDRRMPAIMPGSISCAEVYEDQPEL